MRKKLNTQFNTRQYMVSRDFEIYYYKDQHMKKVANHIHDYYEIYFFLEGDVSLEIEKKEYPLQYGDVAVVLCIRMRRTGFWAKMAAVLAIVEKTVCQISAIRLMR